MSRRAFRGVWIPAGLWEDRSLSVFERVLLAEIDSLTDDQQGGCYASNGYFALFFGLSPSRISEAISSLAKRSFLKLELRKETKEGRIITRRYMRSTHPFHLSQSLRSPSEKRIPPSVSRRAYSENPAYIITGVIQENGARHELTEEDRKKTKQQTEEWLKKNAHGSRRGQGWSTADQIVRDNLIIP